MKCVLRHDYNLVFGVDVTLGLTKAERLLYGESMMTHAMAFTAVSLNVSNLNLRTYVPPSVSSQMSGEDRLGRAVTHLREHGVQTE
jgi:aminopeptidase C